ncbi:NAD(P)/FAD-dependent oxidoreductase [Agarilytica rhodophyticola]|uniref:NAD(P)/FAD-dependent oxidoreductase n=1 Tax=Agarilytica rhodophyticola TaxID=1737490 RepID=UPI000B344926|nr:tryptophan 7-halogenase [Agarilytica rhodophyticola]
MKNLDILSEYDVTIVGGGLAGSTLAHQIRLDQEDRKILVVEANSYPLPLAKFKVGESTVDMAGHYLKDMLGLKNYLEKEQLPKYGLRFFLPAVNNTDITKRVEIGNLKRPESKSYQIDRGHFENHMRNLLLEENVSFIDSAKISDISIGQQSGFHEFTLRREGQEDRKVKSRWLIDASGQAQILKKQLDLTKNVNSNHFSVWFRVNDEVEINALSNDPDWLEKVPEIARKLCTNHLLGEGYWIWIIPLSGGCTSIGIVADCEYHSMNSMNTLPKAFAWLDEQEPQFSRYLRSFSEKVMDFKRMDKFTYSAKQVFSSDRWALTGIAGTFTDPFYSPGTDFIAISNTLINKLIIEDFEGKDISSNAKNYEQMFFSGFDLLLSTVENQYGIFKHNLAMSCKVLWDATTAWSGVGLVFCSDHFTNDNVIEKIGEDLFVMSQLHTTMQQVFRRWSKTISDRSVSDSIIVDRIDNFTQRLQNNLTKQYDDESLVKQIAHNRNVMSTLAVDLFSLVEEKNVEETEIAILVDGYQHQSEIFGELKELLFYSNSVN